MPIRKGKTKLYRTCKKCNNKFEPSGKFNVVCGKCMLSGKWIRELIKKQKIQTFK